MIVYLRNRIAPYTVVYGGKRSKMEIVYDLRLLRQETTIFTSGLKLLCSIMLIFSNGDNGEEMLFLMWLRISSFNGSTIRGDGKRTWEDEGGGVFERR